jgi:hypothetical protein
MIKKYTGLWLSAQTETTAPPPRITIFRNTFLASFCNAFLSCKCYCNAVERFGTLNDTWETMRAEQLAEAAAKGQALPVANDPNWPSVEW